MSHSRNEATFERSPSPVTLNPCKKLIMDEFMALDNIPVEYEVISDASFFSCSRRSPGLWKYEDDTNIKSENEDVMEFSDAMEEIVECECKLIANLGSSEIAGILNSGFLLHLSDENGNKTTETNLCRNGCFQEHEEDFMLDMNDMNQINNETSKSVPNSANANANDNNRIINLSPNIPIINKSLSNDKIQSVLPAVNQIILSPSDNQVNQISPSNYRINNMAITNASSSNNDKNIVSPLNKKINKTGSCKVSSSETRSSKVSSSKTRSSKVSSLKTRSSKVSSSKTGSSKVSSSKTGSSKVSSSNTGSSKVSSSKNRIYKVSSLNNENNDRTTLIVNRHNGLKQMQSEICDEEIMKCVKNWHTKYPWMGYDNRRFICKFCQNDSSNIFKLDNHSQIYFVSAKLSMHETSSGHQQTLLSLHGKLRIHVVDFLRRYAFSYTFKAALYEALSKSVQASSGIKITEQELDELIPTISLRFQILETDKIRSFTNGEISYIVDECRNILIIKIINSSGQPEEFLFPKFLEGNINYLDLQRIFPRNFVYVRKVFCGSCVKCHSNGRTFSHSTLPVRFPEIADLTIYLEKDTYIKQYATFLMAVAPKYHWTKFDAFTYLKKEFSSKKFDKFLNMEIVLFIISILSTAISKRQLLPLDEGNISVALNRLTGVLLDTSVLCIKLFMYEVNQKFYTFGVAYGSDFDFLFQPNIILSYHQCVTSVEFMRMFSLLKHHLLVPSPAKLMTELYEFTFHVIYKLPHFIFNLSNILHLFQEDILVRQRFGVAYKLYKLVALLPCIDVPRKYTFFDASVNFCTLVTNFGKSLGLKIMQIVNAEPTLVQQFYKENTPKENNEGKSRHLVRAKLLILQANNIPHKATY